MCVALLGAIPGAAALGTALGTSAAAGGLVIAGTTLAGASAGLQFLGQRQAASSQEAMWHQTAQLTAADLRLKYQQMQLREMEERSAFAQQSQEIQRRTAKALGFTQAAAAQSGVYGSSVATLLQDFGRQQAESLFALQRNSAMRSRQMGLESLGMQSAGVAAINRAYPDSAQPSILSPLFQTAGQAMSLIGSNLGPGSQQGSNVPYFLARPS